MAVYPAATSDEEVQGHPLSALRGAPAQRGRFRIRIDRGVGGPADLPALPGGSGEEAVKRAPFTGQVESELRRGLAGLKGGFAAGRDRLKGLQRGPRPWLPTMSLYLEEAFDSSGARIDWERYRCGPTSYRFGKDLVLFRYATRNELLK